MTTLPVAADHVPEHLYGWATQMAARYGHPVFLTGSALSVPSPRDWDVRCVLPDDEFSARYGIDLNVYDASIWLPRRYPQLLAYFSDMAKLSRSAVMGTMLNIDFQVQPLTEASKYKNCRRKRLDLLTELPDLLPIPFGGYS